MPRPFSTRRSDRSDSDFSAGPSDVPSLPDSKERLRRLAALTAVGEAPLPADLGPEEHWFALAEVARLRRERLVNFVARAIALDIQRRREP